MSTVIAVSSALCQCDVYIYCVVHVQQYR